MKLTAKGELQLEPGESVMVKMQDQFDPRKHTTARIGLTFQGQIEVAVAGYGDCTSEDGEGSPILVEKAEDKLRVICWADINKEDPTTIIDMEDAKENKRSMEMGA